MISRVLFGLFLCTLGSSFALGEDSFLNQTVKQNVLGILGDMERKENVTFDVTEWFQGFPAQLSMKVFEDPDEKEVIVRFQYRAVSPGGNEELILIERITIGDGDDREVFDLSDDVESLLGQPTASIQEKNGHKILHWPDEAIPLSDFRVFLTFNPWFEPYLRKVIFALTRALDKVQESSPSITDEVIKMKTKYFNELQKADQNFMAFAFALLTVPALMHVGDLYFPGVQFFQDPVIPFTYLLGIGGGTSVYLLFSRAHERLHWLNPFRWWKAWRNWKNIQKKREKLQNELQPVSLGGLETQLRLSQATRIEADALIVPYQSSQLFFEEHVNSFVQALKRSGAKQGIRAIQEHVEQGEPFPPAQAILTESGGGKTSHLFHVLLETQKPTELHGLVRKSVLSALTEADRLGNIEKVAIPLLGKGHSRGNLTYFRSLHAILEGILEFQEKHPTSSVQSIEIALVGDFTEWLTKRAQRILRLAEKGALPSLKFEAHSQCETGLSI